MRCLLLALVAGLAVLAVSIRAVEIDEEEVKQLMADLFDDEEYQEAMEEQESNRESRARGRPDEEETAVEEKAADVDPKDQERYNSFFDTLLRRLNSLVRNRFQPLSFNMKKEGRRNPAAGKDKPDKNKAGSAKKGKKKGKGKKQGKGGKKNSRHPKDLTLEEKEEREEEFETEGENEEIEVLSIEKRAAENDDEALEEDDDEDAEDDEEEESLARESRGLEDETEDKVSRRGKPAAGKKGKGKKGGRKSKGKKKKGGKKGKGKKGKGNGKKPKGKKDKRSPKDKISSKDKRSPKDKRSSKSTKNNGLSRAIINGIATLRRDGDVSVKNKKGGKEMKAKFVLGPVDLSVSRKFGSGKSSITKEAKAISPELTGKMSINIDKKGKAKLTSFRINKPAIVEVEGSIRKEEKGGKHDNNFMENSIGRYSPIVTKKLKAALREILNAAEPKGQATSN
ncbi:hypothetical protein SK128_015655 [Halocaridina rubra]|uniref:Uncharacterized protein n=1 Tax=Halocaridina rubra TaxID=373956 RepID=A0AAN8X1X3_HALRR